jgi:hypothetical protein
LRHLGSAAGEGLQDALPGGQASGFGISLVVRFPSDRRLPVVSRHQRLMRRQHNTPCHGLTRLVGGLAARLLTEDLERAGADPNRQAQKVGLEQLGAVDLGSFELSLERNDHQASAFVDLCFTGAQPWEP